MQTFSVVLEFSIIFQGGWWSQFWPSTALEKVLQTLGIIAFGWIIKKLIGELETLRKMRSKFSITGIWIGICKLPSYPPNVEAIEIYQLVVKREHVAFKFFNYRPDVPVSKYEGKGIYRGNMFSAFYYIPQRRSFESGVFVVRLAGLKLRGTYAQFDPRAEEKLLVSPKQQFELMRIRIPLLARLKMRMGWPPYYAYSEVEQLFNGACLEYPPKKPSRKRKANLKPVSAVSVPPP